MGEDEKLARMVYARLSMLAERLMEIDAELAAAGMLAAERCDTAAATAIGREIVSLRKRLIELLSIAEAVRIGIEEGRTRDALAYAAENLVDADPELYLLLRSRWRGAGYNNDWAKEAYRKASRRAATIVSRLQPYSTPPCEAKENHTTEYN